MPKSQYLSIPFCLIFLSLISCLSQGQLNDRCIDNPVPALQTRMTLLSFIAYCKSNEIIGMEQEKSLKIKIAIEKALQTYQSTLGDWELVWGPAVHFPGNLLFSDALACIVRETATGDCAVVMRGTNPFSLWTWLHQDLQIASLVSWEKAVSDLPATPQSIPGTIQTERNPDKKAISLGAYNSLAIHTGLKPVAGCPGADTTLLEFLTHYYLSANTDKRLYYTGHSLGGLLAPTLALWVQDKVEAMRTIETRVATLAGLTAGNAAFAAYSNQQLHNEQDKWLIRFANPLDLFVNVWNTEDMQKLIDLYYPIFPLALLPGIIAAQEIVKDKQYTQVGVAVEVKSKTELLLYAYNIQVIYQHVMPYLIVCFGEEQAYEIMVYIFELSFSDLL